MIAEREKKLKAEQRSPRKSPTKTAIKATIAANENTIDLTPNELMQVKANLDGMSKKMHWKTANPGKRLPKGF